MDVEVDVDAPDELDEEVDDDEEDVLCDEPPPLDDEEDVVSPPDPQPIARPMANTKPDAETTKRFMDPSPTRRQKEYQRRE